MNNLLLQEIACLLTVLILFLMVRYWQYTLLILITLHMIIEILIIKVDFAVDKILGIIFHTWWKIEDNWFFVLISVLLVITFAGIIYGAIGGK